MVTLWKFYVEILLEKIYTLLFRKTKYPASGVLTWTLNAEDEVRGTEKVKKFALKEKMKNIIPKFGKQYYCRYGEKGKQVCMFLGFTSNVDIYIVRKWLANSRRWTKSIKINRVDLFACVKEKDSRRYSVEA